MHEQGSFLGHFIWLLLCLLSATRGWGVGEEGKSGSPKRRCSAGGWEQDVWVPGRKLGLRHSIQGREKRGKAQRTQT